MRIAAGSFVVEQHVDPGAGKPFQSISKRKDRSLMYSFKKKARVGHAERSIKRVSSRMHGQQQTHESVPEAAKLSTAPW